MPPVDGGPCGPSPWQTLFLTVHDEITEPPGPCDVHLVIPFKSGPHVDVQGISLAARDTFWKRSKGPGRTASGCDLVHEPAQVCQAVQRGHTPQAAVFRAVPAIWRQSSCHSCPVLSCELAFSGTVAFVGHFWGTEKYHAMEHAPRQYRVPSQSGMLEFYQSPQEKSGRGGTKLLG